MRRVEDKVQERGDGENYGDTKQIWTGITSKYPGFMMYARKRMMEEQICTEYL